MVDGNIEDDNYVANLLKKDAEKAAKRYELVGIDAFNPKRSRSGAPKPNTNFLRHIIRQTDSHNAALLAKEGEESRARLRKMNRQTERDSRLHRDRPSRGVGRLTPPDLSDDDGGRLKKRRRESSDHEGYRDDRSRRKHHDKAPYSESRKQKERDYRRRREHRSVEDSGRCKGAYRKPKSSRDSPREDKRRRYDYSSDGSERAHRKNRRSRGHSRCRSQSRSASRTRSPSPRSSRYHRSSRHRHRSRSRSRSPNRALSSPNKRRNDPKTANGVSVSRPRSQSSASESDPLETIVGPLPPPAQPLVRSRGRGAHKAASMGMDARFSSTYNPSDDVRLGSDVEDDWGDALEVLKDRQRWKQQGADRLRAAGFTDEQVRKWEMGDEKNEEDVVWASKGQAREWDRGKVVDEEGDVSLKAEWGRLT